MRVGRNLLIALCMAFSCSTSFTAPALAQSSDDWPAQRQAEFAAWQAQHPDNNRVVAEAVKKSVALYQAGSAVAAADAAEVPDVAEEKAYAVALAALSGPKYASLRAQSKALRPNQLAEANRQFATGFNLWQAGDYASAEIAFREGLATHPASGMAHFYLGDILIRKGDKASAAVEMDMAAELAKGSAESYKALAALKDLPPVPEPPKPEPPPMRVNPPRIYSASNTPVEYWECPECPKMVVIPAGGFSMGSNASEQARVVSQGAFADFLQYETPVHTVTIARPFAAGMTHVTRGEYAAFARETGTSSGDGCVGYDTKWVAKPGLNWQNPGFAQTERDPVVCISWQDAQAYVAWLNRKVGDEGRYRLLTEAEWEFAARAGTTTAYWWGDTIGSGNANCKDCGSPWDVKQTSPAGSFRPNSFGLYDMNGNARQWVQDCFAYSYAYAGAPSDGQAVQGKTSCSRIARGGSFSDTSMELRSANRSWNSPDKRDVRVGFRLARTLP